MFMFQNFKIWQIFIILYIVAISNGYFFVYLSELFDIKVPQSDIASYQQPWKFILVVIITPLIETLLFQHLPIQGLKRLKISNIVICIITACLFGLAHFYHILYVIMAFISGFMCAFLYVFSSEKKSNPFWVCFVFHALYNLFVMVS